MLTQSHYDKSILTTPSHTHIPHSCKYVGLSWLSPKGNVGLSLYPHGPLTIDAHRLTDRYAALFPKAYPARRFGRVCVCVRQSKGLPGSGLWCRTFTQKMRTSPPPPPPAKAEQQETWPTSINILLRYTPAMRWGRQSVIK